MLCFVPSFGHTEYSVPRFTGKTRITGKTAEIPERGRV